MRQRLRRQWEGDRASLTRLERDALEAPQVAIGPSDFRCRVANVELNDFVASALARVRHVDLHRDRTVGRQRRRAGAKPLVSEGRVAQPMAEGIERLTLEETIRTTLHVVVLEGR